MSSLQIVNWQVVRDAETAKIFVFMNEKINKTSIGCILFLDIIDYSTKSVSEQIDVKNLFNSLINYSLKDIAQNDRIILDTGDGAAIALIGPPEDALFVALSIRDGVLKTNGHRSTPLLVKFGINLGPIRIVNDINAQLNIVGDGINVAQRIMSFAKPNQILVSRSYYDIASRLTKETSQLFEPAGLKRDKHEREHEIYTVTTGKEKIASFALFSLENLKANAQEYWKYVMFGLVTFVILVLWFGAVLKYSRLPEKSTSVVSKPAAQPILMPNKHLATQNINAESTLQQEQNSVINAEKLTTSSQDAVPELAKDDALAKKNAAKKRAKKKTRDMPEPYEPHKDIAGKDLEKNDTQATVAPEHLKAESESNHDASAWKVISDSVKQGKERPCTQAERALVQCR